MIHGWAAWAVRACDADEERAEKQTTATSEELEGQVARTDEWSGRAHGGVKQRSTLRDFGYLLLSRFP